MKPRSINDVEIIKAIGVEQKKSDLPLLAKVKLLVLHLCSKGFVTDGSDVVKTTQAVVKAAQESNGEVSLFFFPQQSNANMPDVIGSIGSRVKAMAHELGLETAWTYGNRRINLFMNSEAKREYMRATYESKSC